MLLKQFLVIGFAPMLFVLSHKCSESKSSEECCENSIKHESSKASWNLIQTLNFLNHYYRPKVPAPCPSPVTCPPPIPPGPGNPGPQGPSIESIISGITNAIKQGAKSVKEILDLLGLVGPDECEAPEVFDATTYYWNETTCQLECNWPPFACALEGQTYNTKTCDCRCPNEAAVAPTCQAGQIFSPKNGCKCIFECTEKPPLEGCPQKKIWCEENCKCICDPALVPRTCGPNQYWNQDTCTCDCSRPLNCAELFPFRGYEYNPDTCQCECPFPGNPGNCRARNPLWDWSDETCRCQCANEAGRANCPFTTLSEKFRWNSNTCKCECVRKLECDPALFTGFNPDTCECNCINRPPEAGCDFNFAWNRRECACTRCVKQCAPLPDL